MISILILTKNEEQDLPSCLRSVSWCDDVHVFDSYSTDQTIHVAIQLGAAVTQRKFDGYASQRNAALTELPFKHKWVLILDADEHIPAALAETMLESVKTASSSINGFRIRRRDYFESTWLKHSQMTPFYVRLVRLGKAHYHRQINEVLEVDGLVVDLAGHFEHYPFSKGISHWLDKHNTYSTMEAKRWIDEQKGEFSFSFQKALFGSDFSERRYHQKGLFYKIPARPIIKWIYLVIWKKSFLDGKAGIINATLQAIYEYFIVIKTRELLAQKRSVQRTQQQLNALLPSMSKDLV